MTHNGKKNTKKIWRIQKLSLPLHRKQQKMVQTYGAMVAQQILVLLVEVRILIGLQALRQKWRRAFLLHKQCRNCHFFLCKETFYPKKFLYKERFLQKSFFTKKDSPSPTSVPSILRKFHFRPLPLLQKNQRRAIPQTPRRYTN